MWKFINKIQISGIYDYTLANCDMLLASTAYTFFAPACTAKYERIPAITKIKLLTTIIS